MIPVKEAISTGAWLHCEYTDTDHDEIYPFRIKVLSFRKLNLKEVDNAEELNLRDTDCNLWIMELEAINIKKEPVSPTYSLDQLILMDQDDFQFHVFRDSHLRCWSEFAEKSKLNRFYGSDLIPKIKAVGAIPFQLPYDDEAVYSISMKEGSIREA
jgi:hypothetical protein